MALILVLDEKHFRNGLVSLRRGDDWVLDGKVIDKLGTYSKPKDLTGVAASAFFPPAETGTDAVGLVTIVDGDSGDVRISMDAASSPAVALAEQGTTMYLTLETSDGLMTVELPNPVLEIADRGFNQF